MLGCFSSRDRDSLTQTSDGDHAPDRRVACRAASGCGRLPRWCAVAEHGSALPVHTGSRLLGMVRHYRCALDCRPWCGSHRIAVAGHGSAFPVRPGLPAMVRFAPDRGWRPWSAFPVRPGLAAMALYTRIPVEPSHARLLFVTGSRWPDPDVGRRSGARPKRCLSGGIRLRAVAALVRGCRAWLGTTRSHRIAVTGHGSTLPVRPGLAPMVRCAPDRGWRPWSAFPVRPGLAAMVRCASDRGWWAWFRIPGAPRIAGHGPVHPDPGRAEPCSAAFRYGLAIA